MRSMILSYFVVLAVFLAIDFVWLSTMGKVFYAAELGSLMRDKPLLGVAFLFYALFAFGLYVFVVQPNAAAGISARIIFLGGLFGLVAYATYDLTNLSTMRGFSSRVAIVDMVWGTLLSTGVTVISIRLIQMLKLL